MYASSSCEVTLHSWSPTSKCLRCNSGEMNMPSSYVVRRNVTNELAVTN